MQVAEASTINVEQWKQAKITILSIAASIALTSGMFGWQALRATAVAMPAESRAIQNKHVAIPGGIGFGLVVGATFYMARRPRLKVCPDGSVVALGRLER